MSARAYRSFALERGKVTDRTIAMLFSSEFPVVRVLEDGTEFEEVLCHEAGAVDLSRLQGGAPLLEQHDFNRQRGVVESAEVDLKEKVGRATARFGKSPEAEALLQDVNDGIKRNVSVGYDLVRVLRSEEGTGGRRRVFFAWAPFEISIVSAPEDPRTGIGRGLRGLMEAGGVVAPEGPSTKNQGPNGERAREEDDEDGDPDEDEDCDEDERAKGGEGEPAKAGTPNPGGVDTQGREKSDMKYKILREAGAGQGGAGAGGGAPAAAAAAANVTEIENRAATAERTRAKEIRAAVKHMADNFPQQAQEYRDAGERAIEEGTTAQAFKDSMFTAMPGVKKQNPVTARGMGLTEQEIESYSIGRAIRSMLTNKGKIDGLEGEVHQEMENQRIGVTPDGIWIPTDVMIRGRSLGRRGIGRRDAGPMNAGTFAQGGALVPTILMSQVIEPLRNRLVVDRLGVQSMTGLTGNVAIPRQSGVATAYALPESNTLQTSILALDQIQLSPHRVGAAMEYTKQLLLQAAPDVENLIRNDLFKVLAIKWDALVLQGAGAGSEPTGIFNTPGIGSVLFGAAATWAKILEFESALALANADDGNIAFVTTPLVRKAWKAIAKIGSTFPVYLWEKGNWGDGTNDGAVNDYRAAVTNQVVGNLVYFGNWEDAIGPAMWGGFDLVVNPYSKDRDGVVRLTLNTYGDAAVRHAGSFCVSADAGNQ